MGILKDITRFTNRIRKKAYYSLNVAKITKPNANDVTPLERAIQQENLELVRFFIGKGALRRTDNDGNTPLHRAVLKNKTNIAKFLIAQGGAQVNDQNEDNNTPLHLLLINPTISEELKREITRMLLQKGAKADIANNQKETALHWSNVLSDAKMTEELILRHPANINDQDKNKYTALHITLEDKYIDNKTKIEIVNTLLKHGADITLKDIDGDTPMHLLLRDADIPDKHRLELLKAVMEPKLQGGTPATNLLDIQNDDKNTLLNLAVVYNMFDIVGYLIRKGANPNIANVINISPIHMAAMKNSRMTTLLLQKAYSSNQTIAINAQDSSLHTALHWVIGKNDLDKESKKVIVQTLLDYGADPNLQDKDGNTPLHLLWMDSNISIESKREITLMLLQNGAKADIANNQKETVLGFTLRNNYPEIVLSILRKGNIDVNLKLEVGITPLQWAVWESKEMTELMLQNGAKINGQDVRENTPLHHIVENNKFDDQTIKDIVETLLTHEAGVNKKNVDGNTPLHLLLMNPNISIESKREITLMLLQNGAKADIANNQKETVLGFTLRNNYPEIVLSILEKGNIDVNLELELGITPLHWAVSESNKMTELMLQNSAKINSLDIRENTPLHHIVENDKFDDEQTIKDIVETLLTHKAGVNKKNVDGNTPLHLLLTNKHISIELKKEIAKALLKHGADITLKNIDGNTPLHLLLRNKDISDEHKLELLKTITEPKSQETTSATNLLDIQNDDGNTLLHTAIYQKKFDIMKYLLSEGADPNIKNKAGYNPIHLAVITGSRFTELLLQEAPNNPTVDINVKDYNSNTALHWAIGNNDLDKESKKVIVQTLLDHGADPNLENLDGHSALHLALIVPEIDEDVKIDLIHMLKDYEAYIDIQDAQQNTILHRVIEYTNVDEQGKLNIINSLLGAGIDLSKLNNNNESYLHLALQEKNPQITKLLVEHNILDHIADISLPTEQGNSLLHLSMEQGNDELTNLLLKKGILDQGDIINKQDENGNTLLLLALKHKNYRLAHTLLDKGADIDVPNRIGETPVGIVNQSEQSQELDSIRKRLSSIKEAIQYREATPVIKKLLNKEKEEKKKEEQEKEISSGVPNQPKSGTEQAIQPGQGTTIRTVRDKRPSLRRF